MSREPAPLSQVLRSQEPMNSEYPSLARVGSWNKGKEGFFLTPASEPESK